MAGSKHDFTATEIKAGLLVISSFLVAAVFVAAVLGMRPPGEKKVLYAKFTNTIGLDINAPVRFGGYPVGVVSGIVPDPEDHSLIRLRVEVAPNTPVNEESIATVEQTTLTAPKHLEITTGTAEAPLLAEEGVIDTVSKGYGFINLPDLTEVVDGSGDLLADLRDLLGVKEAKQAEEAGGEEFGNVERVISDVRRLLGIQEAEKAETESGEEFPSITALSKNIQDLLGVEEVQAEEAQGAEELASVAKITGDVRDLIGVEEAKKKEAGGGEGLTELTDITHSVDDLVDDLGGQIDKLITDLEPMKDSVQSTLDEAKDLLADNRENIDRTLKSTADIAEALQKRVEELSENLNATLDNVEGLTDEAKAVIQAKGPALEEAIGDLGVTVRSLNSLLEELKRHPQSVIWGKPEEGRN
ncbi:MAG: MCE family protein [Candidatus Hydrogenedentes bacterium]|nr:MCE family protein [Candidatus Hydrogenedentota bacterium]